jgi:hypothetical protein
VTGAVVQRLINFLFVFGLLASTTPAFGDDAAVCMLSLRKKPHIDQRIIAFDIELNSGSISFIPALPEGWFFSIKNDASGSSEIIANVQVGAAAMTFDFFEDFIGVRVSNIPGNTLNVKAEFVSTKEFISEIHWNFINTDFDCHPQHP